MRLLLILNVVIPTISFCQSSPNLIDQPALQGVLQIRYKNESGASFQYKGKNNKAYLITAKHIFQTKHKKTIENGTKIHFEYYDTVTTNSGENVDVSIFYNGKWTPINAKLYYDKANSDVAILLTNLNFEGNNFNLGFEGLTLSQECYFLGFPLGLKMDYSKAPGFNPYPLPFVRKGIVSAFGVSPKGLIDGFYIDGHNTYGFSGGPLLFFNYKQNKYFVAGIVASYLPQQNLYYKEDGSIEKSQENSGVMIVSQIGLAINILKELGAW